MREGPHSRRKKFFARQPQVEEMYSAEWDPIRLVYGHGVTDRIFPMLPAAKVDLVFVARDPMSLFASRIKHKRLMQSRLGKELDDVEELRSDYRPNEMARNLIRSYGSFVEGPVEASEDVLRQVLQCVRHLFCTEKLSEQLVRLNASLGLPAPPEESRRVSQDRSEIRPHDEAAFQRENRLDYLLYELALESGSAGSAAPDSLWFDRQVWEEKSERTRAATKHAIPLQEGIASTVDALIADNGLEAAVLQMQYEKARQRRNHGLYMQAAEAAMARYTEQLKPLRRKRNDLNVMSIVRRNGDFSNLWQRAQKYVDENGSDPRALRFWKLAKRELAKGRHKEGVRKRSRQGTPIGESAKERTATKART